VEIRQSAGKSYAYLLGVYLGDGCVTVPGGYPSDRRCFRLNTIDRDFAETVKSALDGLTDQTAYINTYAVKKSSKPNHSLVSRCDDLCWILVEDTEKKQIIPSYVAGWSKENRLAFIVGLMDSEGFVGAHKENPTNRRYYMGYKSCDPWVPDFVRLLEITGIRIGKVSTEKPLKEGYKAPTRFTVKMQSWVDSGARFNIARKQDRVDEWASAGPYENRSWRPRRLSSEANMPNALATG